MDAFATGMPVRTQYSTAAIIQLVNPVPSSPTTFSGTIAASQQIPVTPIALLPWAPMMPETCVPCP